MRIDFSDENIKPIAGDVALLAYAYYIKFGATEAEEAAVFRLGEFLVRDSERLTRTKRYGLPQKLRAEFGSGTRFAAAVLENFGNGRRLSKK